MQHNQAAWHVLWPYVRGGFFLSTLIICIFIGERFVGHGEQSLKEENSFFSRALSDAQINESVSVHKIQYEVLGGTVFKDGKKVGMYAALPALRLAYLKATARYSPIFALPGSDTIAMENALNGLSKTAQLLSDRQKTLKNAFLVRNFLYPADFLSALNNLEKTRQTFLASGSDMDAYQYEMAQEVTMDKYQRAIVSFEDAFESAVPDTAGSYGTETLIVSRDSIIEALGTLGTAAKTTQHTYASRKKCFEGDVQRCGARDLALPSLPSPVDSSVSPQALALARQTRSIFEGAGYSFTSQQFIQLSKSSCVEQKPSTALLYGFRMGAPGSKEPRTSSVFLGDARFVKSDSHLELPFFEFFAKSSVPYVYLEPLAYYECVTGAAEHAKIFATQAVVEFAIREHLSTHATEPEKSILEEMEGKFIHNPIISDKDAVAYLRAARETMKEAQVSKTVSDLFASVWLRMSYLSDGLYQTIVTINLFEQTNMRIADGGVRIDIDAKYLFYVRSAFASLFLETNRSVSTHKPLFEPNTPRDGVQPYVFYSSLTHTPILNAQLEHDIEFFRLLHAEPSQSNMRP